MQSYAADQWHAKVEDARKWVYVDFASKVRSLYSDSSKPSQTPDKRRNTIDSDGAYFHC